MKGSGRTGRSPRIIIFIEKEGEREKRKKKGGGERPTQRLGLLFYFLEGKRKKNRPLSRGKYHLQKKKREEDRPVSCGVRLPLFSLSAGKRRKKRGRKGGKNKD